MDQILVKGTTNSTKLLENVHKNIINILSISFLELWGGGAENNPVGSSIRNRDLYTWTEQKPKKDVDRTKTQEGRGQNKNPRSRRGQNKNPRSKELESQKEHIIDKRPYIEPKRICPHRTKKKKSI